MSVQAESSEERQVIQSAAEVLRREGREEGLEKGREKAREEIAAELLQDGMEPEKVANFTRLSQRRILKLQRDSEENSEH